MTAGACALLLEFGVVNGGLPSINTRIARILLARGAQRKQGLAYPNNVEGFGSLNFQNALSLI